MAVRQVPGAEALAHFAKQRGSSSTSPAGGEDEESTAELKAILEVVAITGQVWHDWGQLRVLLVWWMDKVLRGFNSARESGVEVGPPRPLVTGESFDDLRNRLFSLLDAFPESPPFTIQRVCEILLNPHCAYTSVDKVAFALEKALLVTSSIPISSLPYPALPFPPADLSQVYLPPRNPRPSPPSPIPTPPPHSPSYAPEILPLKQAVVDDPMAIDSQGLPSIITPQTDHQEGETETSGLRTGDENAKPGEEEEEEDEEGGEEGVRKEGKHFMNGGSMFLANCPDIDSPDPRRGSGSGSLTPFFTESAGSGVNSSTGAVISPSSPPRPYSPVSSALPPDPADEVHESVHTFMASVIGEERSEGQSEVEEETQGKGEEECVGGGGDGVANESGGEAGVYVGKEGENGRRGSLAENAEEAEDKMDDVDLSDEKENEEQRREAEA